MKTEFMTVKNDCESIRYYKEDNQKTILYFHGGGLIYGTKTDLPQYFIKELVQQGFDIIAIDYLLAPNATLSEILEDTYQNLTNVLQNNIKNSPFIMMGRSAGAYLMLKIVEKLLINKNSLPEKIISFYGFYDLGFLNQGNEIFPIIPEEALTKIDLDSPVYDDPYLMRSLLYAYFARKGKILDAFSLTNEDYQQYNINTRLLLEFPACFLSASSTDKEVPFSQSKQLKKMIPQSTFVPVYHLEHDFLKLDRKIVDNVIEKLLEFLKDVD